MDKNKYVFLDDFRYPKDTNYLRGEAFAFIMSRPWTIVRNYEEFVKHITEHGLPNFICFDHDLADIHYQTNDESEYSKEEKTGADCAKWLCEYCEEKSIDVCSYLVHSQNPIGAKNIKNILEDYSEYITNKLFNTDLYDDDRQTSF